MENTESKTAEEAASEPVSSEPDGPSRTERQWAMGCHLIALCGFLVPPIASTVATVKASEGITFRYPACIRLIK